MNAPFTNSCGALVGHGHSQIGSELWTFCMLLLILYLITHIQAGLCVFVYAFVCLLYSTGEGC